MAHEGQRAGQQGSVLPNRSVELGDALANHGTQREMAVAQLDVVEPRNPPKVHEDRRLRPAESSSSGPGSARRPTAGLRRRSLVERGTRFGERSGSDDLERRWLHATYFFRSPLESVSRSHGSGTAVRSRP